MSTPEPVDERPAGTVEIRGGDRDEDFMPQGYPPAACGPDCTCQDKDTE
jgi:hypothetical protein